MRKPNAEGENQVAPNFYEVLKDRLENAYKIGALTYIAVTSDVSSLQMMNALNLPGRAKVSLSDIRSKFNAGEGSLWVGVGVQDSPVGGVVGNVESVLGAYSQLLRQDVENKRHTRSPRPGVMRAVARNGNFSVDHNFLTYWQDVLVQAQDNKAFWQYAITQLRAVTLGFAGAAGVFNDLKTRDKALRIVESYEENQRIDPLDLVGLKK